MIASILACPKCSTLIMEDTAICPGCHHVLKKGYDQLAQQFVSTDEKYDGSQEIPCRECQAMNRKGMVRCWQCGAFMREEIERIYQEMQTRPNDVIGQGELFMEDQPLPELSTTPVSEDDFELDDDFVMYDESQFEESSQEIPALQEAPSVNPQEQETLDSLPVFDEEETAEEEESSPEEDELLKLAVREERENNRQSAKRKRSAPKGSFLMKGPCGDCKIRVQNYHQGMMGQCPKCALPFMVPILAQPAKPKKAESGKPAADVTGPLPEAQLIESARWQDIPLKKFKPKALALANQGETIDLIQRPEGLLIVWPEKKGLMGAPAKQTAKAREQIAGHLLSNKPLDKLPASRHELLAPELLAQARLVRPATSEDFTEGIDLFGPGWIVIEIPAPPAPPEAEAAPEVVAPPMPSAKFSKKKPAKPPKPKKVKPAPPVEPSIRCLRLTLSQYRKLRAWLAEWTQQENFLLHPELPLENNTRAWTCALNQQLEFEALADTEYYEQDPLLKTTAVGWQCQCGQVAVSETSRIEQKFGGKKPAGLTKAKCPVCEQNFGQTPLVHLTSVVAPEEVKPEPTAEEMTKAADTTTPQEQTTPAPEAAANEATATEPAEEGKKKGLGGLFRKKK